MNTHKHYLHHLLITALLVFAVGGIAGAVPPGQPFQERSLALGSQFDSLLVTCGTFQGLQCPRFRNPMERPYVLHYVTVAGSANIRCNIAAIIERETSDGTDTFRLGRFSLLGNDHGWYPPSLSSDNAIITFPVPLRGRAGDKLGAYRFPPETMSTDPNNGETCLVYVTYGIEYLE